jgi:hypothetical protein
MPNKILSAIFLLALAAMPATLRAAVKDADVERAVCRGLEWLAAHQSRMGHWNAQSEHYPTAMTGLSGIALLRRLDHDAGQIRPEHPPRGRLSH